jgi:hypothetical protein
MTRRTPLRIATAALAVAGAAALSGAPASAAPAPRFTICHATASVSNPYVRITVSQDAVDGDAADHGRGDHFAEHTGPVGPVAGGAWGDIIPPVPGVHDGLNWTDAGRAVFDNGCAAPAGGDDGGGGGIQY